MAVAGSGEGGRIAELLGEAGLRAGRLVGDDAPDVIVCSCPAAAAGTRREILDLKRGFPGVPVVAVVAGEGPVARAALAADAEGLVYGSVLDSALAPTVRAVCAEQVVIPLSAYRRAKPVVLSHRERQVLRLAVEGMTNDSIASALYLSLSTVKSHLTSAFAKLSVRSRSEAAVLLLDPDEPAARQVFTEFGARAGATAGLAGGERR